MGDIYRKLTFDSLNQLLKIFKLEEEFSKLNRENIAEDKTLVSTNSKNKKKLTFIEQFKRLPSVLGNSILDFVGNKIVLEILCKICDKHIWLRHFIDLKLMYYPDSKYDKDLFKLYNFCKSNKLIKVFSDIHYYSDGKITDIIDEFYDLDSDLPYEYGYDWEKLSKDDPIRLTYGRRYIWCDNDTDCDRRGLSNTIIKLLNIKAEPGFRFKTCKKDIRDFVCSLVIGYDDKEVFDIIKMIFKLYNSAILNRYKYLKILRYKEKRNTIKKEDHEFFYRIDNRINTRF